LSAFLEECEALGTLEEVLEESGFVKRFLSTARKQTKKEPVSNLFLERKDFIKRTYGPRTVWKP